MSGAIPGTGLLKIAERLFDRATLDRVIVPAIADLQHECERASAAGLSNWFVRARAYCGVLQTIVLCAARDVVVDRDGVCRSLGGRMLVLVPLFVVLSALPGNGWLVSFAAKFGADVAVKAGLLLLLANLVLVLPIAFYFAVALQRRHSGLDGLSVAAFAAACVILMAPLMLFIVPETNQSYRLMVLEAYQSADDSLPRPLYLPKGLHEMTLTELNDQIAHPPSPSQEALARRHRQERFAYIAASPVLGFVALALARRRRSQTITIALSVLLLVLYFTSFHTSLLGYVRGEMYSGWAANALLLLIGFGLFTISVPTLSPEMEG